MSGHSKWSTIKRQKGAADAKRGQLFTKLSQAITIAARQGGVSDPASNFKLRLAIEAARSANMPKDNIDRAIQRALGAKEGDIQEVLYEGFGPGGFSVIVEAITDNKQRTTPEVRNVFEKNGGSMATPGAVSYQFKEKGFIVAVNKNNFDEIFMLALDSGAEDIEEDEGILIYTEPSKLAQVRDSLTDQGVEIKSAELIREPVTTFEVSGREEAKKALDFIQKLEDMDDVQKVYANFNIPDHLLRDDA